MSSTNIRGVVVLRYYWGVVYNGGMSDAIILSNGAAKDPVTGHFLPGYRPKSVISDRTQAVAMAKKRWENARKAVSSALKEQSGGPTPYHALQEITKAQYDLATDAEKGRASTEAAKFIFRAGDFLPDNRAEQTDTATQVGEVLGEVAIKLLEYVQNRDR